LNSSDELNTHIEINNIETDIKDKTGNLHTLRLNIKRVSIKEGTVLYTCHDITDHKQVEDELKITD